MTTTTRTRTDDSLLSCHSHDHDRRDKHSRRHSNSERRNRSFRFNRNNNWYNRRNRRWHQRTPTTMPTESPNYLNQSMMSNGTSTIMPWDRDLYLTHFKLLHERLRLMNLKVNTILHHVDKCMLQGVVERQERVDNVEHMPNVFHHDDGSHRGKPRRDRKENRTTTTKRNVVSPKRRTTKTSEKSISRSATK